MSECYVYHSSTRCSFLRLLFCQWHNAVRKTIQAQLGDSVEEAMIGRFDVPKGAKIKIIHKYSKMSITMNIPSVQMMFSGL